MKELNSVILDNTSYCCVGKAENTGPLRPVYRATNAWVSANPDADWVAVAALTDKVFVRSGGTRMPGIDGGNGSTWPGSTAGVATLVCWYICKGPKNIKSAVVLNLKIFWEINLA